MAIRFNIAGLVFNASHASHRTQMAPEHHASIPRHPDIRLIANKANNTLSIVDSGIGMSQQGLADIVRKGQQNISRGIGVTFYTASLAVRKVTVRTKDSNGCLYKCESMEDGSFHISEDDNTEQLHRGTEITLFLCENQLEYLEEEVIKDLVEKECESVGYPILYLKVEKEPEVNEGEIQEVVAEEWQVIHEPKAVADMRCQIKDGILEMNPNNEKVKKLINVVERGETIELAEENKPKKPVWKRMIDRLCTCVITHGACAAAGAVESALDGDGDAYPF